MLVITALGSLRQKDCQDFKANISYTVNINTTGLHGKSLSQKVLPRNPQEATQGQDWPWPVKVTAVEKYVWTPTCSDSR